MKLLAENLLIEPSISGGAVVRFETLDIKWNQDIMHKYDGKKMTVEIKEKRSGRSLDANAYCWVLCDKIASTKGLLMKKTDVYRKAIKDYGVSYVMPVKNALLGDIIRWHTNGGYGNDCDVIGKSMVGAHEGCDSCIHCKKYVNDYTRDVVCLCNKKNIANPHLMEHLPETHTCNDWDNGYTNVMFYQGSSVYDTKQMSILIDGLVADAKELGIETMTPDELERIKTAWGDKA